MAAAEMDHTSTPLLPARNREIQSLSERINTSTRSTHTQLNRLIIARLPLALPPHTSNPSLYATGLLHIAPIYITFESLWRDIISADRWTRTRPMLSELYLPGLLRSTRLRSEISQLSGRSLQEIDDELTHSSHNASSHNASAQASFIEHIESSVAARPHVLVAYAWVLYMALFSGGRYLRASLQKVSTDFWLQSPSVDQLPQNVIDRLQSEEKTSLPRLEPHPTLALAPGKTTVQPLHQFFCFPGVEDGEDIKREFKRRFSHMETQLSDGEKDDIIEEAQHIFRFMVGLVGDLDAVCNTDLEQRKEAIVEGPVGIRSEGGPSFPAIRGGREWLLKAWSGRQDVTRPFIARASLRVLEFGLLMWVCLIPLLLIQEFLDQHKYWR